MKGRKYRGRSSGSTLRRHEDQSKVQRKEPESSPTAESGAESGYSSLSFKSDRSKDFFTDFKSNQPSTVRRDPVSEEDDESLVEEEFDASSQSNDSTDMKHHFNSQHPVTPESFRRMQEELLRSRQEVTRLQQVLYEQEVTHQQEVIRLQKALIRQQETHICLQATLLSQQKTQQVTVMEAQQVEQQANQKLQLRRGKKWACRSERIPPGSASPFLPLRSESERLASRSRIPPGSDSPSLSEFSDVPLDFEKRVGSMVPEDHSSLAAEAPDFVEQQQMKSEYNDSYGLKRTHQTSEPPGAENGPGPSRDSLQNWGNVPQLTASTQPGPPATKRFVTPDKELETLKPVDLRDPDYSSGCSRMQLMLGQTLDISLDWKY